MSREAVRLTATPSQTVGPFFHFGLADDPALGRMAAPGTDGTPIRLRIVVTDGDRSPVPDALIELWQADAAGHYSAPAAKPPAGFSGFGRLPTGADGTCVFETILPGRVPDGRGGLQAAHVNVCFFSRGLLRQLYTRIYFAGAPGLDDDPILTLVAEDRRRTLLAQPDASGGWTFDIRLQGDGETVFFDL